jgi:cyclic beta-1,2-glucan synthetase
MAGDIYGSPPYVGRGGWSWYTGSAAWLHRAALETLLGLSVRQGVLSLSPRVPAHWPSFQITLRLDGNQVVTVHWDRGGAADAAEPVPDQVLAQGQEVVLADLPARAHLLVRATPT